MPIIHNTALVDSKAELADDVEIGAFTIIEADVKIAKGTKIASNVLVSNGARIGENCKIFNGAVLATQPQDLKFDDEKTFLEIGDNTTVREYATLNRGTTHSYTTRIGSDCLIMSYCHVAHDCQIGNNVILANSVNLAGHVIIDDFVGIGGLTPVHQFAHIGAHSFIGGGYRVSKDVPPYILAMGEPLSYGGLNRIGLQRRGFPDETVSALKKAYRILYRQNNTVAQAIEKITLEYNAFPNVMYLVDFLRKAERGIIR